MVKKRHRGQAKKAVGPNMLHPCERLGHTKEKCTYKESGWCKERDSSQTIIEYNWLLARTGLKLLSWDSLYISNGKVNSWHVSCLFLSVIYFINFMSSVKAVKQFHHIQAQQGQSFLLLKSLTVCMLSSFRCSGAILYLWLSCSWSIPQAVWTLGELFLQIFIFFSVSGGGRLPVSVEKSLADITWSLLVDGQFLLFWIMSVYFLMKR